MHNLMNNLSLPTYRAIEDYKQQQLHILIWVFERLIDNPDTRKLVDCFTEEGLYHQLIFHQKMLLSACECKSEELFRDYQEWRYRVITHREVSAEYFVIENTFWIRGIQKFLFEAYASEFITLYHYLISNHRHFSDQQDLLSEKKLTNEDLLSEELFGLLLKGDEDEVAYFFGMHWTASPSSFFLDNVVKPAMIKVGKGWENNTLSVSKEHIATSIIERVWNRFLVSEEHFQETSTLVFVITPAEQLHKLGSKMVGSLLYQQGWRVAYLSLHETFNELFEALIEFQPRLIVISAMMPIHIPLVQRFIGSLREPMSPFHGQIAIGGQALYRTTPPILIDSVDFQGQTLKEFELFVKTFNRSRNEPPSSMNHQ